MGESDPRLIDDASVKEDDKPYNFLVMLLLLLSFELKPHTFTAIEEPNTIWSHSLRVFLIKFRFGGCKINKKLFRYF